MCAHTGNVEVISIIILDGLRLFPIPSVLINRKQTRETAEIQIIRPLVPSLQLGRSKARGQGFKSAGRRYQT